MVARQVERHFPETFLPLKKEEEWKGRAKCTLMLENLSAQATVARSAMRDFVPHPVFAYIINLDIVCCLNTF